MDFATKLWALQPTINSIAEVKFSRFNEYNKDLKKSMSIKL